MVTTLSQLRSSDAWHASQEICYDAPTYIYAYFYGTRDIRCGKGAVSLRGMWQPYLPVILPLLFYSFYSHSAFLVSVTSLHTWLMSAQLLESMGRWDAIRVMDQERWSFVETLFVSFGDGLFADEWPSYILGKIIHDRRGLQTISGVGLKLTVTVQCEGPVLPLAVTRPHREIPATQYFDSTLGQASNAYIEYGKVTSRWLKCFDWELNL